MAPPYGWAVGAAPPPGRRRRDWVLQVMVKLLINVIVVTLSQIASASPRRCPLWARTGAQLTGEQLAAVARLELPVRQFLARDVTITDRAFRTEQLVSDARLLAQARIGLPFKPSPPSTAGIHEGRAVFAKEPADFDPCPFLGVFAAAAHVEPDLPRLDRIPEPYRPSILQEPGGSQRGRAADLISFFNQWDVHGRLHLELTHTIERTRLGSLFAVPKTELVDRIVFNRVPQNAHEFHLPGYARFCIGGHDLTELIVPRGHRVTLCSDDLNDAFPSFRGTVPRALTNGVAWTAPLEAFAGTRAHKALLFDCRRGARAPPHHVRPCHLGLPMGDINAAEWCAEAHTRVLRASGSFQLDASLLNGRPPPRGGLMEALVIDDHLGCAVDAPGSFTNARLLMQSFDAAGRGYAAAGLSRSAKKARRGVASGVFLGAEFVEGSHLLGSERHRRRHLCEASLVLVASARSSRAYLRRLLASWTHVLLYRRSMLSLLSSGFNFVGPVDALEHHVVALPRAVILELKRLVALAGLACTNLAAEWAPDVLATDASNYGIGVVAAEVEKTLQHELWRHRDRRGRYTRIHSQWQSRLRLADLDHAPDDLEGDLFGSAPSPQRVLIECFDFVELCCGPNAPLMRAHADRGMRVGPKIDILAHPFWDLGSCRIVEWLLFLAARRRVWSWHSGVPCTDFSIAKCPKQRTADAPWGLDPNDPERRLPNFYLAVACCILLAVWRSGFGHATHEHPATAFSWRIPFWSSMASRGALVVGRFCACAFGAPFRKDTRLARVRASHLEVLDKMCTCPGLHDVRLEGALTKKAAEYSPNFCAAYAAAAREAFLQEAPALGEDDVEQFAAEQGQASEMLWLNELSRCLPWRQTTSAPLGRREHINLTELRTAVAAALAVGRRHPGCRVIILVDSRVAIGAAGKGRSCSISLNRILRAHLPELLARDVYMGFLFIPSRLQPADAASRLRASPVAAGAPLPSWAKGILVGEYGAFDALAALPKQSKGTAGWASFVVKLAAIKIIALSPKELPFDSTLGYPGEGPSARTSATRDNVDIRVYRNLTPAVAARRRRLLREFSMFIQLSFDLPFNVFLDAGPDIIDRSLAAYGQCLYSAGRTLLDFSEMINAVVDERRHLRGHLPGAWDAAWVWRAMVPGGNRTAAPEQVFLAMLSVSLLWNLDHLALLIGAGFLGLLRPHEIRHLKFSDFMTPGRLLSDASCLYITVQAPKMRRITAKRSYTRVDEPGFVAFADAYVPTDSVDDFIFNGSYALFRQAFLAIAQEIVLPVAGPLAMTWGSFRPGGATWLLRRTDNPELVRFRGRWASSRMLEIYVQEVGAVSLLPALSGDVRARVRQLAAAAPGIFARAASRYRE